MNADDLLLPETRTNPYPFYSALRAAGPIHWAAQLDAWVLTRYADVTAVLRNPQFSSRRVTATFTDAQPELQKRTLALRQSMEAWALFSDPPNHTRVRALLSKAFAPALMEAMRGKIQSLVEELLAVAAPRRGLEIVADIASPLPAIVIAEMVGVAREDRDKFKRFSDALATLVGPAKKTAPMIEEAMAQWQEMEDYLIQLIGRRRSAGSARPDDLLGALLAANEAGSWFTESEVRATIEMLLFAGHETTTNLIANGMLILLRHPQICATLRQEPGLIPAAIEEMLRLEPPVQMVRRVIEQDMVLAGTRVQKGQRVLLLLASANRDPAQFSEPDRFVVDRRESRALSFGFGIHFCSGAALARLEAQAAFAALLGRFPNLRLAAPELEVPILWRDHPTFRCPQQLQVLI